MALAVEQIELLDRLLRAVAFVSLYLLIGFGPGYICGVLAANRFVGKGNQLRMERRLSDIEAAIEHNKQWHPEHERWKKQQ